MQALGKTWSDLIDEGDISNIAAQQMQQGTWRRHSGTLQKLTRYLKCTAGDIQECMRVHPDEGGRAVAEEPKEEKITVKKSVLKKPEEQAKPVKADVVEHPAHYTSGSIECIDALKASMSEDEFKGFLKGNVQKYIWRYTHKNGVEDLRKARWYLDRLIGECES